MSLTNSPNYRRLKKAINLYNESALNEIFLDLLNDLVTHLNLDLENQKFRIKYINEIDISREIDTDLYSYGVSRIIKNGVYIIKLFKNYHEFFPFFLLQTAYLLFVPSDLREKNFIKYAINQFIEFDLQEFNSIDDWKIFVKERYENYEFRFDKYLELKKKETNDSPKQFFFEYIRRYPNLNLDEDLYFLFDKIYREYLFKISNNLISDDIIETLRIVIKIFYKSKKCDSLQSYYTLFKQFRNRGLIQTQLSFRSFRKNLRWINKFTFITPTFYLCWKALNTAVIPCFLKFNPLIDKVKIDLITSSIPFLLAPKLSIDSFSVELFSYFVIPSSFIKDLIKLLNKMEKGGIIIDKRLTISKKYNFSINLNYFREFYHNGKILTPYHKNYSKEYEIDFTHSYNQSFLKPNLNLMEFLILERLRFFSYYGLSFSRKKESSTVLKSDYNDFILKKKKIINKIDICLQTLSESTETKRDIIKFLVRNQKAGYFFIRDEIDKWIKYLEIIENQNNRDIISLSEFKEEYKNNNISFSIEKSVALNSIDSNSFAFKKLYLDYYNSRDNYEKEAMKLRFYKQFFSVCDELKIFNIQSMKKIIESNELLKDILKTKKKQLDQIKINTEKLGISSKVINTKIEEFLERDPKLITPYLINSFWTNTVAKYFPLIILKNSLKIRQKIDEIKKYFPNIYYYESLDLFEDEELIFLQLNTPHLKNREKVLLISLLKKIFKEDLIAYKRYSWNGTLRAFSRIDFYNFDRKEFFYTEDLFNQYFLYIKRVLDKDLTLFNENTTENENFWTTNQNLPSFIKKINKRVKAEDFQLREEKLQKLSKFHSNLEEYFIKKQDYEKIRKQDFFKNYIKSIKIIPNFSIFGLSQYFLFITPFNIEEIDFKLLLTNSFQKVKYNASIGSSNSLFIRYIFPINDPNASYLNWLRGQYKIREYCLFQIESVSQILHFDTNLSLNRWYLDSNNFKLFIQKILFDSNYKSQISEIKHFNVASRVQEYFDPDSKNFQSLLEVYNWQSIDIRKKIPFLNQSSFDRIQFLIKNKIVFPYLNLKNLGFREVIHILLINVKNFAINILKNVFQYFNLAFIYEIKGEYYIHGFEGKKSIIKGLMVKLYLPNCELADFLQIIEYVFQYLKIEKYLILTDLVNGEHFVKKIFGDNKIYEKYNPLTNLIWDPNERIWKNHKLFGPRFEYLYPDIYYNQKEEIQEN